MDKQILQSLYGTHYDADSAQKRFDFLISQHLSLFNTKADAVFSTSGRTELGGNHTDHNLGCVVAASISLDTIAAVHKTDDNIVHFVSQGYNPIKIKLDSLKKVASEVGKTDSLIRGIAASFQKRGAETGGFCANVCSSVLRGSGLSSSASVEVLIATIFNCLYNGGHFSTTELAIIGREAENNYFGKPCGLMDQVACANGGVVGIDFFDFEKPVITPVKADFESWGYYLVITDTKADHADLTDDYAAIPSEMRAVASFFKKDNLAHVDPDLFYQNISELRQVINNDRAIIRAHHFFAETQRAGIMIEALTQNNRDLYLSTVLESGLSSFRYLQNIYSCTHPKMQAVSIALALSEKILKDRGVCRVHGGGFAGTIQSYVPFDKIKEYTDQMEKVYGKGCCCTLAIRNVPTTILNW